MRSRIRSGCNVALHNRAVIGWSVMTLVVGVVIVACPGTVLAQDGEWHKTTHVYKTVGDTRIEADIYRAADKTLRPVVVWIHGGALVNGTRTAVPGNLIDLCRMEGYALASLDYRLAPEVKLPAIAEDIDDAVTWLRKQGPTLLHVNPDRCVITGESAGGYLALLAATRLKPPPRGLIAYWGFADIRDIDSPAYVESQRKSPPLAQKEDAYQAVGARVLTGTAWNTATQKGRSQFIVYVLQNGLWAKEVAGFEGNDRRQRELYSPVRTATRNFPPTLLIHGTADRIVLHAESAKMAAQLARLRVPHELISVSGADHGLRGGDRRQADAAHTRAAAFIRQRLSEPAKSTDGREGRSQG